VFWRAGDYGSSACWRGVLRVHFHIALWEVLYGMSSDVHRMERRELRHDRHTVSLLTDNMVFSPKQPLEILVGDVALALDDIIRKTCKDLNIEIIDMAVNVDHVHLFVKYPPKYSVSYISRNGVIKVSGHHPVSMDRWAWMGDCGEIYTKSGEAECENAMYMPWT